MVEQKAESETGKTENVPKRSCFIRAKSSKEREGPSQIAFIEESVFNDAMVVLWSYRPVLNHIPMLLKFIEFNPLSHIPAVKKLWSAMAKSLREWQTNVRTAWFQCYRTV